MQTCEAVGRFCWSGCGSVGETLRRRSIGGGAPMAAAASPGVELPSHVRRGLGTSWSNQQARRGPAGSLGRG
jgi:hypothetical protein